MVRRPSKNSGPGLVRELLEPIDVHADDVRRVRLPAAAILERLAVTSGRSRVRGSDVRNLGRVEPVDEQPRGFSDAEL